MKEQNENTSNPEDCCNVYQIQFDSNNTPLVLERPLFLNTIRKQPEVVHQREPDILFANQLRLFTHKESV